MLILYFILAPRRQSSQVVHLIQEMILSLLYCFGSKIMATKNISFQDKPNLWFIFAAPFIQWWSLLFYLLNLDWTCDCFDRQNVARSYMIQIPSVDLRLRKTLEIHAAFTSFVPFSPPCKEANLASGKTRSHWLETKVTQPKASTKKPGS